MDEEIAGCVFMETAKKGSRMSGIKSWATFPKQCGLSFAPVSLGRISEPGQNSRNEKHIQTSTPD